MFSSAVREKILIELAHGTAAREAGLEGQARVCARRAAGAAIRAYFDQHGYVSSGNSAIDLLQDLAQQPEISPRVLEISQQLLQRVDTSFSLPDKTDLLAAIRELVCELQGAWFV